VVRATELSESTVTRGLAELDWEEVPQPGRVRRPGAGNKPITDPDPEIVEASERLVDPVTRGDPESRCGGRQERPEAAEALRELGHDIVDRTVLRLSKAQGYSLQANKKAREGAAASRSRRAVCAHQPDRRRGDRCRAAGDQRRYQEA